MKKTLETYWKAGLKTLPTGPNKAPHGVKTWLGGVKDLKAYEGAHGIGIICGKESGGLECLDFDNHFGDAKRTLGEFIAAIKPLYYEHNFPIQSTQSGGYHLLYRCEKVEGNQKLAQKPKWNEREQRFRPDAIIETRGEGGYFVAAPTKDYAVIRNTLLKIPTISPKERDKLIFEAKQFNKWYELTTHESESEGRPGDLFNQDIEAGESAKQALRKAGWNETQRGWTRPDKKEGISATFGKVAENIFYCFSSNAYPFEPNKAYSPFQVVALLQYNGDFKAFAKDLSERYQMNQPKRKEYAKPEQKPKEAGQIETILKKAFINVRIPVNKPPLAMEIVNRDLYAQRLFTLGNFSAITGKSKSKKTFLSTAMLSAAIINDSIQNKLVGKMPEGKRNVVLFDTEQSEYDAYITAKRAVKMAGLEGSDNFMPFDLREFTPKERCEIIEYTLEKYKDSIGFVVIDGVADLANAINDEEEASRVVSLLMKWTKVYQIHIVTIIHQNKNDNFATGHLGSSVMKKSECVISVEKDKSDKSVSRVTCDLIRGVQDFDDFALKIDDEGLPVMYFENERKKDEECPF